MERFCIAALVAALVACGGSNNSGSSGSSTTTTTGGGSSGGSTGGSTTGTAGSAGGFVIQPTTCNITAGNTTETISVAAVAAATANQSFSDVCSAGLNACVTYKNITTLVLGVSRFVTGGGTVTAVAPGTYTIGADLTGGTYVYASETQTDANCADVQNTPTAKSGTVTLTSVGSTIAGSYSLTMSDASTRSGSFSGPSCGGALPSGQSFCDLMNGSGSVLGSCTGTKTCN